MMYPICTQANGQSSAYQPVYVVPIPPHGSISAAGSAFPYATKEAAAHAQLQQNQQQYHHRQAQTQTQGQQPIQTSSHQQLHQQSRAHMSQTLQNMNSVNFGPAWQMSPFANNGLHPYLPSAAASMLHASLLDGSSYSFGPSVSTMPQMPNGRLPINPLQQASPAPATTQEHKVEYVFSKKTNRLIGYVDKSASGIKLYKCGYKNCPSSFTSISKLDRHQTKHTKDKPYKCPLCSTRFTQASSRKSHIQKSHAEAQKEAFVIIQQEQLKSHESSVNSDIDDAASGDESDVLVAPEDRCPSLRATVRFSLPPEPSEENLKLKEVYFKLKAASDTLNQAVTEYNDAILAESTESTENTENTENTPTSPASDTPSTKKPKLSAEEN